jgi:predicted component of type VI protein secretion system
MIKVLLIVVQGKPEGKTIPITGPTFKVGRSDTCHLRPNSDLISREHAEISVGEDSATIRDLGSRNGTMLNGRTLTGTATLKSGDLVQVGPLTFAVAVQGATVPPATSSQPAAPAVGATKSLDDISHDEIGSWLIADNNHPTPDRPSGVYDGDTLTISAYTSQAAAAKVTPTPPPAPSRKVDEEETTDDDEHPMYERLPEGRGDDEEGEGAESNGDEEEDEEDATEEWVDESNPFYAAKKAQQEADKPQTKATSKDSSEAASEILRKMLDRRRAGRT